MTSQPPLPPDTPITLRQGDLLDLHIALVDVGCLLANSRHRPLDATELDTARDTITSALGITTPLLRREG